MFLYFVQPLLPCVLVLLASYVGYLGLSQTRYGVALASRGPNGYGDINPAAALRVGGFLFGLMVALSGVVVGGNANTYWQNMALIAVYAVVVLALMSTALFINDRVILPDVDNHAAIKSGNMAVALVEAGTLAATGIILRQAVDVKTGFEGLISTLMSFGFSQLALVMITARFRTGKFYHCGITKQIENGGLAGAFVVFGVVVAYSFIVAVAAGLPFEPLNMAWWISGIAIAFFGAIALYVFDYLIDLVIIRWTDINGIVQNNCIGSGVFLAAVTMGAGWWLAVIAAAFSLL